MVAANHLYIVFSLYDALRAIVTGLYVQIPSYLAHLFHWVSLTVCGLLLWTVWYTLWTYVHCTLYKPQTASTSVQFLHYLMVSRLVFAWLFCSSFFNLAAIHILFTPFYVCYWPPVFGLWNEAVDCLIYRRTPANFYIGPFCLWSFFYANILKLQKVWLSLWIERFYALLS